MKKVKRASQQTVESTAVVHTPVTMAEKDPENIKDADLPRKDIEAQLFTPNAGRPSVAEVKVSFRDINPFGPLWEMLRRTNNAIILFGSGDFIP